MKSWASSSRFRRASFPWGNLTAGTRENGRLAADPRGPVRVYRACWILAILLPFVGCASFSDRGQALVPTRYKIATGPFLIFSNSPMKEDSQAVRCLQALERDVKQHLDFAPAADEEPVEIYVLDDREAFTHFLKFYYPELPPRRAFFLAQDRQRVVYTFSSPRLEEDLRHEATHALLHGSFGDLPLWLDEGLAEFFENDLVKPGAELERVELINKDLAGGWSPELERLAAITDIRHMTPRDYREAWAWVHLFLKGPGSGKTFMASCLKDLHPTSEKVEIWQRLAKNGATTERLLAHLKAIPSQAIGVEGAPADASIRLQDKPAETPTSPSQPRGLWRRVRGWIGF
jgi:hypothetical protein